jgi:hypothetical protein
VLSYRTMAAKGIFENPLTPEVENEKALDLLTPVPGARKAAALNAALWKCDELENVRMLRPLSRVAAPGQR